jgi:translation initiation factor 2 beta subunit (eIF-2beta)/eIF-5
MSAYVKNEKLLFVMLYFKLCTRCNDSRKLLTEWSDLAAARVVFLKGKVKGKVVPVL